MSNTKTVMSQAANTLTAPLNVEDVFSTYLYTGNDTSQTITNGIDLDGEGGMTWLKTRDDTHSHYLFDTERGAGYYLNSDTAGGQAYHATAWVTGFNSDGFDIGYSAAINDDVNDHVSWTWRKAPKFFDVVTYTGDGVAGRTVSHNLGTTVGSIFIKELTQSDYRWMVYHRSLGNGGLLRLDSNGAASYNNSTFNSTDPASDLFTLDGGAYVNGSGKEYVAYLFAHNDGDGGFNGGDIIKCGSASATGLTTVNLGFEPQFVLIKSSSIVNSWHIFDSMRGLTADSGPQILHPNLTDAEYTGSTDTCNLTSTGFTFNSSRFNGNGDYIYIAIRRGTKAPESATEVFALQQDDAGDGNAPAFRSDFPVDAAFSKNAAAVSVNFFGSRLQGANYLRTSETNAEAANADFQWDYMNGWNSEPAQGSSVISYMWKRAPGYFDVIAYTGNGSPNNGYRDVNHNLGVQPEMMWLKRRDSTSEWTVNHKDAGAGYLNLTNSFNAYPRNSFSHNDAFTAATFSAKAQDEWNFNVSGATYIAYLFASLPGISKVGSFSHTTGSTTDVDCGFSSGARFVLFKRTSATGVWFMFDTERGIVSGNDPYLRLDDTSAEINLYDLIDPLSSGFTVGTPVGTGDYIFYAIA